jgi:cell fate (sporulation/competence/biofilm development) regulator YlbF (YheA/YmcA/DUF963 family)
VNRAIELADTIAASVSDSDIYKDFVKAKNEILQNPVLYDKMKRFKSAHIDFCNKRASGNDIPLYDEINVSRMYFELLNYKSSKEYLKNEQLLIKLMMQVYEHLSTSCVELFTGLEV